MKKNIGLTNNLEQLNGKFMGVRHFTSKKGTLPTIKNKQYVSELLYILRIYKGTGSYSLSGTGTAHLLLE